MSTEGDTAEDGTILYRGFCAEPQARRLEAAHERAEPVVWRVGDALRPCVVTRFVIRSVPGGPMMVHAELAPCG